MHALSHLSYPYIVANLVALLFFGYEIPLMFNLAILLFSWFPDFDYAVDFIIQKFKGKKYEVPGHHHGWVSHWPIVYSPLIIIAVITGEPYFIIAAAAIYVHLLMDMFYCNQGVMLLYPFSKKWYILASKKTKGKYGWDWNNAYKKLPMSYVDKIAFLLVIVHFVITYII